jgi:hypothetical protein
MTVILSGHEVRRRCASAAMSSTVLTLCTGARRRRAQGSSMASKEYLILFFERTCYSVWA